MHIKGNSLKIFLIYHFPYFSPLMCAYLIFEQFSYIQYTQVNIEKLLNSKHC